MQTNLVKEPRLGASLSRKRRYLPNAIVNGSNWFHCFVSLLNRSLRTRLCSRPRSSFRFLERDSHIGLAFQRCHDVSVSLDQSGSNAPNQAHHQAQHNRCLCQARETSISLCGIPARCHATGSTPRPSGILSLCRTKDRPTGCDFLVIRRLNTELPKHHYV